MIIKKLQRMLAMVCAVSMLYATNGCTQRKNEEHSELIATSETQLVFEDQIAMDEPWRRLVSELTYHNGYVYYPEQYGQYHVFKRMNLTTGEISSPCADPLCSHTDENCPFYAGNRGIPSVKIFGKWIVIQSVFTDPAKAQSRRYKRILYNSQTGEWTEFFQTTGDAQNDSNIMQIGDCLYHMSYGMSRTENGETYIPSEIQRYNLKTGVEDVIYSHPYNILLIMAGESRLYFYEDIADQEYRFYSIDKNGEGVREEPTISLTPDYVYQNRIYSHPKNDESGVSPLLMQDMTSGEIITVTEDHMVGSICIDNGYLYYMTKDYYSQYFVDDWAVVEEARAAGVSPRSEPYASRRAELEKRRNTETAYIWKCDLDGSNHEIVLELPGAGALNVYIWNNYLYTNHLFYDIETGERLGTENEQDQPCRIDLATGEVEFLHKLGAE